MKKIILLTLNITLLVQVSVSQEINLEVDKKIQSSKLGYLYGLAVDKNQNIYVADVLAGDVKLFSSKGKLITTIGRKGKGPGEFLVPKNISINNQELQVYDEQLAKLSIFHIKEGSEPDYIRTVSINTDRLPDEILGTSVNRSYAIMTPAYTTANLDKKKRAHVGLIDQDGDIVKESLFKVPAQEYVVRRNSDGFTVGVKPFGSKPFYDVGQDDALYYANTDKMKFYKYSIHGERVNSFSYNLNKKVVITDQDWKKELERLRYDLRSLSDLQAKVDKRYFPLFDWFIVDAKDRIWVAVNSEDRDNYKLLILGHRGNRLGSTLLSTSVELKVIRDGYAFGIEKGKNGVQSVVRYKTNGLDGK